MYGEFLGGHISLVCSWIEALFTLTIQAYIIYSYKMYTTQVIKGKLGLR